MGLRRFIEVLLAVLLTLLILGLLFGGCRADAITVGDFNARVTKHLGAEVTLHTRRALAVERTTEGGAAEFNPYNTTLRLPGSTSYNSVGVQNYTSAAQGIEATVRTLKEQGHGYFRIRRRLRANASATDIVKAFGESDWGTELTLALAVLDDVQHSRSPNTLALIEARFVSGN